jgi:hypothetical protein
MLVCCTVGKENYRSLASDRERQNGWYDIATHHTMGQSDQKWNSLTWDVDNDRVLGVRDNRINKHQVLDFGSSSTTRYLVPTRSGLRRWKTRRCAELVGKIPVVLRIQGRKLKKAVTDVVEGTFCPNLCRRAMAIAELMKPRMDFHIQVVESGPYIFPVELEDVNREHRVTRSLEACFWTALPWKRDKR